MIIRTLEMTIRALVIVTGAAEAAAGPAGGLTAGGIMAGGHGAAKRGRLRAGQRAAPAFAGRLLPD
ncbi:MAG: hypothetical protein LBJ24_08715 [Treponema sp.]|nr:hypothetical protein [Treponema sp.]